MDQIKNEACRRAVEALTESDIDESKSQAAANILHNLGAIFPDDREALSLVAEQYQTELLTGKTARLRASVFSGSEVEALAGDCADCPDNIRDRIGETRSTGYLNDGQESKVPTELTATNAEPQKTSSLPAELYDEDPPKKPIIQLTDIKTLEDAKEFFRVGERDDADIVEEARMQMEAAGFDFPAQAKRLETVLKHFVKYVNS